MGKPFILRFLVFYNDTRNMPACFRPTGIDFGSTIINKINTRSVEERKILIWYVIKYKKLSRKTANFNITQWLVLRIVYTLTNKYLCFLSTSWQVEPGSRRYIQNLCFWQPSSIYYSTDTVGVTLYFETMCYCDACASIVQSQNY